MGRFLTAIGRGLRNIGRFSGRDTLSQFWTYAGSVIVLAIAAWPALFIPVFSQSFGRIQKFAAEHPDQANVVSRPGFYSVTIYGNHPELTPDLAGLIAPLAAFAALTVILLGAAVTRRLHDRDKHGYWAVPPLVFLAVGMAVMPGLFEDVARSAGTGKDPGMGKFGLLLLNNLLYLGSLAALLTQLVQGGTRGANRFGDDPRS